jgi:uncharacterized protein YjbI with pentapeptide repeats
MTNTPTPLDPIAQPVAEYQSNGQTTSTQQPTQTAAQSQPKKDRIGLRGKTLWDWLNLLGVLLVPLMIGVGTILITVQQSAISLSQHESDQRIASSQRDSDQKIANDQFQESLLKTFRDDINHLVLDQHLLTAKQNDPVRIMAQSYTNDALRKLDASRRALVVRFLSDLQLVVSDPGNSPLISLWGADLPEANMPKVDLQGAYLSEANLQGADLGEANLYGAYLAEANLQRAKLIGANLNGAALFGANLQEANLYAAHLSGADLTKAKVTPEQLAQASFLKDAILPDGSRYPSTSYPIPNHQEPTS